MSILDGKLEKDLDWRQLEIAEIKILAQQSAENATRYSAMLRALWVMLYAHFEGFCKYALQLYVGELNRLKIKRLDLEESLAITSLEKVFEKLFLENTFKNRLGFIRALHNTSECASFHEKIFEANNLWPATLSKMLEMSNLSSVHVINEERRLNTLVARRNEIAHGKSNFIASLAEYQPYEDATIWVMIEIALAISDAIDHQRYLISRTP